MKHVNPSSKIRATNINKLLFVFSLYANISSLEGLPKFLFLTFPLFKVLHVIEDVLTPLSTSPSASIEIYNPDAFQFLTLSESLDIGHHRVR